MGSQLTLGVLKVLKYNRTMLHVEKIAGTDRHRVRSDENGVLLDNATEDDVRDFFRAQAIRRADISVDLSMSKLVPQN
jgi:predicted secreted protein